MARWLQPGSVKLRDNQSSLAWDWRGTLKGEECYSEEMSPKKTRTDKLFNVIDHMEKHLKDKEKSGKNEQEVQKNSQTHEKQP